MRRRLCYGPGMCRGPWSSLAASFRCTLVKYEYVRVRTPVFILHGSARTSTYECASPLMPAGINWVDPYHRIFPFFFLWPPTTVARTEHGLLLPLLTAHCPLPTAHWPILIIYDGAASYRA